MSNNYSDIHILDSPESAATALAERMINQTRTAIQQNDRCVWAVSGGSSILKLYNALEEFDDELKSFSKKLIVLWVDERAVPHTNESSNFGKAYKQFWRNYENVRLIPVPYHKNSDRAAREYEETLIKNGIEKDGIDITILGMGTDGHTASLFPENKTLKEENVKVLG
ncbi:MAG: 6-phosphogluconolactonase, partial [Balneolaceae bacterium]|nr:6-phosphogluconolactonase [Balneolaceae bacterium]